MPTTTDDLQQCYETLMLQPGASQEEIKEAYRDLVTVWHPDRFAGNPRLQRKAQAMLKRINDAFERLQAAAIAPAPERRRPQAPRRRAARQPASTAVTWRAQELLERLPMPEILGGLIVLSVLIVVAVVALAIHQLTTSPVPVAVAAGLPGL